MQLQGLLFILLMLIIIPIFILSANDTVFFVISALILLIVSIKNIHTPAVGMQKETSEEYTSILEDLENASNLNIKKFETGIVVVKDFIIILFLCYCYFYINSIHLKILTFSIAFYWICDIIKFVEDKFHSANSIQITSLKLILFYLTNIGTVIIILLVTCNKFINTIL